MDKMYYERVIEEIVEMIHTNVTIYYCNSDTGFERIREYCKEKEKYEMIDSKLLIEVTREVLEELGKRYLYDFRELE